MGNDNNEENASSVSLQHEADDRLLRPLWIASKITHYPCCVFWITFVLIIIMGAISSSFFEFAPNSDRIYLIDSDPYTEDYDVWQVATDDASSSDDDSTSLPQTEDQIWWTIFMMFELDDYDDEIDTSNPSNTDYWILTPENLQTILKYEQDYVTQDETWLETYCYVGSDTKTWKCAYTSLAEEIADHFNYSWDTVTTEQIKAFVLEEYYNSSLARAATIEASFNTEFATTNQTYLYRSLLSSGNPIPTNNTYDPTTGTGTKTSKYENGEDDYDKQTNKYLKWALDVWDEITVKHNANLKDNGIRVVCLIFEAWIDAYYVLAANAATYITYAMFAVLFWMTFHLQSLWLSVLGMLGIMLSFPFAFFIYRCIFFVTYFDSLATLIIFVLLGIGADDVFVFTDAWHQSVHFVKDPSNNEERMTFAYRRASKAMLVTQITTFFAFLATAFSLLLPIKAFGIWAATIVACDYILVITMYPSVLMIHHKYIKKYESKYLCCCCYNKTCCGSSTPNDTNNNNTTSNQADSTNKENKSNDKPGTGDVELAAKNSEEKHKMTSDTDKPTTAETGGASASAGSEEEAEDEDGPPPQMMQRARSVEEQADEYRFIERCFGLKYTNFILKAKYIILVLFTVLFAVAIWGASQLESVDETEEWFFEDHYMQLAYDMINDFTVSEEDGLIDVTVVWGIKGINRKGTNPWDVEDVGKVVWDDSFDASSFEAQLFLYETCLNLSYSELAYKPSSVTCPMSVFMNYTEFIGEGFPWTYTNITDPGFNDTLQSLLFADKMYEFSQSIFSLELTADSLIFVDEESDGTRRVKYIALLAYADIAWDSPASESKKRRDSWKDWMKDTYQNNDNCPDSVCKPLQSSIMWAWLTAQDEFVRSAVQGIGIAMPIAFVVLIISTHNWIVAVFATLDIVGIMVCALAMMQWQGWQFGISESISIVIIIGFSVDYVVHFANAYLECQGQTREERLSFALLTMGVSVASGAVTTLLAGFFLLFPELVFFWKMGLIIVITIIASISWALLFFTSMLAAWGPQYETGKVPIDKLIALCQRDKDDDNGQKRPQIVKDRSMASPDNAGAALR